jgi:hypothetical protein
MWVRLAIVWIGSALGGSLLGAVLTQVFYQGAWSASDIRLLLALATMSLVWTVPGSALLSFFFVGLRGRGLAVGWSIVAVVIFGTIAGGLILCLIRVATDMFLWGAFFGLTTAACWVALSTAVGGFRLVGDAAESGSE